VTISKVKVLKAPGFTDDELERLHQGRKIAHPVEVARPAEDAPPDETPAEA
jgi:hypothetical protein